MQRSCGRILCQIPTESMNHFGLWMPSLVTPVGNLSSANVKAKMEFIIAKDDVLVKELTMIVLNFVSVEEIVLGR